MSPRPAPQSPATNTPCPDRDRTGRPAMPCMPGPAHATAACGRPAGMDAESRVAHGLAAPEDRIAPPWRARVDGLMALETRSRGPSPDAPDGFVATGDGHFIAACAAACRATAGSRAPWARRRRAARCIPSTRRRRTIYRGQGAHSLARPDRAPVRARQDEWPRPRDEPRFRVTRGSWPTSPRRSHRPMTRPHRASPNSRSRRRRASRWSGCCAISRASPPASSGAQAPIAPSSCARPEPSFAMPGMRLHPPISRQCSRPTRHGSRPGRAAASPGTRPAMPSSRPPSATHGPGPSPSPDAAVFSDQSLKSDVTDLENTGSILASLLSGPAAEALVFDTHERRRRRRAGQRSRQDSPPRRGRRMHLRARRRRPALASAARRRGLAAAR